MPTFNVSANMQTIAAQQMMESQNKQAQLFKGGTAVQAPNMGSNTQSQAVVNDLTKSMTQQNSQAINDQRMKGGKIKKSRRRRRVKQNSRKRTNKKKSSIKSRKNMYINK